MLEGYKVKRDKDDEFLKVVTEWCANNPREAALRIREMSYRLARLEQESFENSWRTNPDRMGS